MLNFDILVKGRILCDIASRLKKNTQLLAHKAKLNIYGPGGLFKAHREYALGSAGGSAYMS
jgi:hypothetical protein